MQAERSGWATRTKLGTSFDGCKGCPSVAVRGQRKKYILRIRLEPCCKVPTLGKSCNVKVGELAHGWPKQEVWHPSDRMRLRNAQYCFGTYKPARFHNDIFGDWVIRRLHVAQSAPFCRAGWVAFWAISEQVGRFHPQRF